MTGFIVIAIFIFTSIHLYLISRIFYYANWSFGIFHVGIILVYCFSFCALRAFEENIPLVYYRTFDSFFLSMLGPTFFALPIIFLVDSTFGLFWIIKQSNLLPLFFVRSVEGLQRQIGVPLLILIFALVSIGTINFFRPIEVVKLKFYSPKLSRDYTFLHITDLQFGTIGPYHVKRLIAKINELKRNYKFDFIINTGDQTDTGKYLPEEIDLKLQEFPVYFTLGNHEFYHNLERTLEILREHGYMILRNKNAIFKDINIVGIDDNRAKEQVASILQKNKGLVKKNLYNILAYHRPRGVDAARKNGIDLMLCGHTHGGQVFPYTWLLNKIYDVPRGLTQFKDFAIFVSDGMALWGPLLRLGSRNQITVINLLKGPSL